MTRGPDPYKGIEALVMLVIWRITPRLLPAVEYKEELMVFSGE